MIFSPKSLHIFIFILIISVLKAANETNKTISQSAKEIFENSKKLLLLNNTQTKTFKFLASSESIHELAIIISPYNPKESIGDLSIYFSSIDKNPNETNHEKLCVNIRYYDSCVFELNSQRNESYIYFTFKCQTDKCKARWQIMHIEEIQLSYSKPLIFPFVRNGIESFNFSVPNKTQFSRIVISINEKYIQYVNRDNNIIKFDVYFQCGSPRFEHLADRQVYIFDSNDKNLCFNSNNSMVVTGSKHSIVNIESFIYTESDNHLKANISYVDFLYSQNPNIYTIDLGSNFTLDENVTLLISFKSLSGTKKILYVNGDEKKEDYEKAHWNTAFMDNYYEEEDILITKQGLQDYNVSGSQFHLTVDGDIHGLYIIHYNIYKQRFLPLNFGVIESGLIENNVLINYELELWRSDDIKKLSIITTMSSGHLNIYGRKCIEFSKCELITKSDIDRNYDIQFKLINQGLSLLEFEPECLKTVCYYIFAIMGNSVTSKYSKYSLVVKKPDSTLTLIENTFHETFVDNYQSDVYQLKVQDHSDLSNEVISVSFLINVDVIYIVMKDKMCYNMNEMCSYKVGNIYYPVIYENNTNNLTGVYYIIIIATKRCNVLIYPIVKRKNDNSSFIKLLEGKTFKNVLTQFNSFAYFSFHVYSETAIKVEINLRSSIIHSTFLSISKKSNTENFDNSNFFLSTNSDYLSFTHIPMDNNLIYIITVVAKLPFHTVKDHKIDFSIMYSTEKSIKHLEVNEFFYEMIEAGKTRNFIFFADLNDEAIYISKHVLSPNNYESSLLMTVSVLLNENKNITQDTEQNNLRLTQNDVLALCNAKKNTIDRCPFYVSLFNKLDRPVYYNIIVRGSEKAVRLFDGKEQNFLFYLEEKSLNAYYILVSKIDHLDISAYSFGSKFNMYLTIFHNKQKTNHWEWDFPNSTIHGIKYENLNSYFISFKANLFDSCWPDCVLLMNLVLDVDRTVSKNQKINIILSSKISELQENRQNKFTIDGGEEKIFSYNLNNMLSLFTSLVIDVTNLYGITEVHITLNDQENQVLPDYFHDDFTSFTSHLIISADDLHSKKKIDLTKNPYLLISLKCKQSSCETSLSLNLARSNLQSIIHGQPFRIARKQHNIINFEYFHYTGKNFYLKLNKESGDGKVSITPCSLLRNNSYDSCLNNHINDENFVYFDRISSGIIHVNNNNPNYCNDCAYLISFEALTDFIGFLNIVLNNEFLELQDGNKFLDLTTIIYPENYYVIKAPYKYEVEIIMNVYYGNPKLYISTKLETDRRKYNGFVQKTGNSSIISQKIYGNSENSIEIHNKIYIIVYCEETASNYSISYKTFETIQTLHEGLLEFGTIKQNDVERYIIYSLNPIKIPVLTINTFDIDIQFFTIHIYFKHLEHLDNVDSETKVIDLDISNSIFTINSVSCKLFNLTGVYEIQIVSNYVSNTSYSIVFNSDNINIVPLFSLIKESIETDKWIYYEGYSSKKGFLWINFIECVGNIRMFISDNFERVKNNNFNYEVIGNNYGSHENLISVDKGPIYLALHNVMNKNNNNFSHHLKNFNFTRAYFSLQTKLYDSMKDIVQSQIIPGNEGKINWIYHPDTHKIEINFEPVNCIDECNEDLSKVLVYYRILFSPNENLLRVHGKCGINNYENYKINTTNYKEIDLVKSNLGMAFQNKELNYEFSIDSEIYYLTVVARITSGNDSFDLYYEEVIIEKPEIKIKTIIYYGLTILCLLVIILLSYCGFYYYRHYKKVAKILDYEVKDVKNVESIITNLNASIEMQPTKRYQGLMEEEH